MDGDNRFDDGSLLDGDEDGILDSVDPVTEYDDPDVFPTHRPLPAWEQD
jgi:hypothetical protein